MDASADDPLFQFEEPEWGPLEDLVGTFLAGELMWMNQCGSCANVPVQAYKHRWTRKHLYLDDDLNAYAWAYGADDDAERLRPFPLDAAIERCFAGCAALGSDPEAVAAWRALVARVWAGEHPARRRRSKQAAA